MGYLAELRPIMPMVQGIKLRFLHRAYRARYFDDPRREISTAISMLAKGDVGAHKGSYLYWLRKTVGPAGKVFAYEPQPSLAGYLRSVCTAMKWENVFVRQCALSDSAGVKTLNVPGAEGYSHGASLEPVGGKLFHSYQCEVDTLDRELRCAERVTFMKVDVEGHELRVFRGATAILSKHAPTILFECEARHLHLHTMQDVFAFVEGFGYQGFFFSPDGLRALQEFDPEIHQNPGSPRFWDAPGHCHNFLFVPLIKGSLEMNLRGSCSYVGPELGPRA